MAQRVKNKPELKIVVSNTPEVPAVEPVPEQVEMPFAIVNGEPVTQMPKDLYIPPQAMEVFLEAFEGPLDLLLYLIRRQNLNILDIPLAEITRQYMQYIEVMTELQLELAGEYMVMAATLAEIKSRMLLPRPKVDPEGKEEDPRAELVRRLQEYERFKRAAEGIDSLPRLERDVWTTSAELKDRSVVKLLPTVTLQEMLLAFKDVVVRSEMFAHHHISRERLSVRERMSDVLTQLAQASFVEFIRLFRLEEGRMGVTVTFMALLELVREGLIEIVQAVPFAPLHVRAAGASRKLHVVGGSDALADGTVVDDTTAVVVGEAVVGDVPAVGLLMPGDAGLDSIVEQVLDPNFVDDDFDEDDGPLEGVDEVVDRIAAPDSAETAAPAALEPAVGPAEVGLADAGSGAGPTAGGQGFVEAAVGGDSETALVGSGEVALVGAGDDDLALDAGAGGAGTVGLIDVLAAPAREVALADVGANADMPASEADIVFSAPSDDGANALQGGSLVDLPSDSAVEPVSVVDESAANADPAAVAHAQAFEGSVFASLSGEAADFHEAIASSEIAPAVDSTSSSVADDQSISTDAVSVAVQSVLVAESAELPLDTTDLAQETIAAQQTSAYEVAAQRNSAYEVAATVSAASASESGDDVIASATGLDEAGAVAEPVSALAPVPDSFEPAVISFEPAADISDGVLDPNIIAGQTSSLVATTEHPRATDAVDAVVASVLADVPAAAVEYSSFFDEVSHSSSVTGDLGATEAVEPASAVSSTSGFDQVEVTIERTSTSDASAFGDVDDSPLRHEPTVLRDPTAPLDETSAVVELAPAGDLSPLADLAATSMSASAGVVATGEVSPPDSSTSDFSASLVDLEVTSPDSTTDLTAVHVSAPLADPVATDEDIAVTFDPSVTTPTAVADEPLLTDVSAATSNPTASDESAPSPIVEPSANDEVGMTVDPAVFDVPNATAGSEPIDDTSLEEPPAVDVEYESPEEAVAAGEQPAVDEDVSLVGDTPVAGEASLVGDESVSGGPAVEVKEFAFDELPALDDARPTDQQPAAGAEAVVNKVPGTDEPSLPGEESDD